MAEGKQDDGQEKDQDPTQRKLDQAKEEGQVLSSKEMFVFTTLSMALLFIIFSSFFMKEKVFQWGNLFYFDKLQIEQYGSIRHLQLGKLNDAFIFIVEIMLIIGFPMIVTTILTQAAVGGGINFAPKALKFKANKLDPIKGLKKIISIKGLVELFKAVLKVSLLFSISGIVIYYLAPELIRIPDGSMAQALLLMQYSFPFLIGSLLVALLIIATVDYFWQRHTHKKGLMMSRQDQKDEFKQTEGSPEVKAKIRRMQMDTAANATKQREALNDVKEATAVITNPTHFAVALKYVVGEKGAPKVLAMGKGKIAEEIIKISKSENINIFQSPFLARALFYTSEIGKEISEKLYTSVAIALAYIYRVDQGEILDTPEIEIPDDLKFDENGNISNGVNNA